MKQLCMNVEVWYTDQDSKRDTSNFLDETIYLTMVFEIDVFFVLLR